MVRRLRRPLWFLLGLLIPYLGLCAYLANSFVHPKRSVPPTPAWVVDAKAGDTPVWATPNLAAGRPSRTVVVLAHGFRGNRSSWADLMKRLRAAGIDALAPAMPGMDASPFKAVGFGVPESHTLLECARWARAKGAKRVVGMGLSLGGAATWLASGVDPKAFDGIVTDAAFAQFDQALDGFLSRRLAVGKYVLRPVVWLAQAMTGIDPSSIRPIDAAERWRGRPALIIQGMDDTLIRPFHGERLSAAVGCPEWKIEGAEHAMTYATNPKAYAERVIDFVKRLEH